MKKIFLLCLAIFTLTISAYGDELEVKNNIQLDNKQETQILNNKSESVDNKHDVDWGPYMREFERRMRKNWNPPQGDESKSVVVVFTIKRDGSLSNTKIIKSSGSEEYDSKALMAVKQITQFDPLPDEFKGNSVDIEFTFDYNVISPNNGNTQKNTSTTINDKQKSNNIQYSPTKLEKNYDYVNKMKKMK